jgi:hypothetical protein
MLEDGDAVPTQVARVAGILPRVNPAETSSTSQSPAAEKSSDTTGEQQSQMSAGDRTPNLPGQSEDTLAHVAAIMGDPTVLSLVEGAALGRDLSRQEAERLAQSMGGEPELAESASVRLRELTSEVLERAKVPPL